LLFFENLRFAMFFFFEIKKKKHGESTKETKVLLCFDFKTLSLIYYLYYSITCKIANDYFLI